MTYPFISCFVPTYGRPKLLEEVIQCFLLQDYPGRKELVILNDMPGQILYYDHPEVILINTDKRIEPLGAKFNATCDMCSGDFLTPWDDDDIYLPHKLTHAAENIVDGIYHTGNAWFWSGRNDGSVSMSFEMNQHHPNLLAHREKFEEVGYYPIEDHGGIDGILMKAMGIHKPFKEEEREDVHFMYRWNSPSYHISSLKHTTPEVAKHNLLDNRKDMIILKPHWSKDWAKMIYYLGGPAYGVVAC